MFCEKCGAKNEDNARFCETCGSPMTPIGPPADPPQAANASGQDAANSGSVFPGNANPEFEIPKDEGFEIPKDEEFELSKDDSLKNRNENLFEHPGEDQFGMPPVENEPGPSKKPMKKLPIFAIVEAALILCAIIFGVILSKKSNSPTFAAEKYIRYLYNGDYEKAFEMMDIAKTDFLNAKMLKASIENNTHDEIPEISGIDVRLSTKPGIGNTVNVTVNLKLKGVDSPTQRDLTLNHQTKLFFFKEWKVDPSEGIFESKQEFIVPKGAELKINGTKVSDEYKKKIKKEDESIDEGDTYELILFNGGVSVEVEADGYDDYKGVHTVGGSEINLISQLILSDKSLEEMQKLSLEYLNQYFKELKDGNGSSDWMNVYFAKDEEDELAYTKEQFKNNYSQLHTRSSFSYYYPIVEMNNIVVKGDRKNPSLTVEFTPVLSYDGQNGEGYRKDLYFYFSKEDGKWKIGTAGSISLSSY